MLNINFFSKTFFGYHYQVQSNSVIVEKMVAPKFSTILEFSTTMDFCVVQGNELNRADGILNELQNLIYNNSS